jgi:hypothetical protein
VVRVTHALFAILVVAAVVVKKKGFGAVGLGAAPA